MLVWTSSHTSSLLITLVQTNISFIIQSHMTCQSMTYNNGNNTRTLEHIYRRIFRHPLQLGAPKPRRQYAFKDTYLIIFNVIHRKHRTMLHGQYWSQCTNIKNVMHADTVWMRLWAGNPIHFLCWAKLVINPLLHQRVSSTAAKVGE